MTLIDLIANDFMAICCSLSHSHFLISYRLWRRWFRLYGPLVCRVLNFLLLPDAPFMLFDRSPFPPVLLNWYRCINGISRSEFWLMTKSSLCDSSAFSFASIALIVSSLLIFVDIDVRTAKAGISTFVFGLSISSYFHKKETKKLVLFQNTWKCMPHKMNIEYIHNLCFWRDERPHFLYRLERHWVCVEQLLHLNSIWR